MRLKSTTTHFGGAIVGGSCPATSGQNHDIVITHNHGTESDNGNLAPLTGFNHIDNWTIAYNVLHDDNCPSACNTPHGFYMGGNQGPSSNTTIRRNLIFRNSWNGLHWNGQATGFFIDQNVVYDNGVTGLDFEMGLSHSYIRANLSFNNAKQMILYDYPGSCPTQSGYVPSSLYICPGDENYNLIENNIFYATGNANMPNGGTNPGAGCPTGVPYCALAPIQISNSTNPLTGDLGHNTFRNNIIVAYGWNGAKPGLVFGDPTSSGTCGAACQSWAQTSTFDHNLFWQSDGLGGSTVLLMGPNTYTCSSAATVTAAFTNCNVHDPQFAAEAISHSNVESYFDFRLLPASPALHAGSITGIPNFDAVGNSYASNPSLGALESSSAAPPTSTTPSMPPTISITSPTTGASLQGTVSISATASPGSLAIASIQFKVDGVNSGPVLSVPPYAVFLATAGLTSGTHTISATAIDTAGNTGASAGVTVTVNNPYSSGLPPTQGLTGYWNFNEDSGATAHDSSGNGYNGTVTGAPWVTGYVGSALSFNGGSYVVTSTIPQGGAVSISAWVNPAMIAQIGYARIAETQYNIGFYLGTDSTGTHYKFIVNNGAGSTGSCGTSFGCVQGGTVSSGWHLITGTYDGTTATLYVDNAAVATDTVTAPAGASYPLYIGRCFNGGGYGWNGTIDEVRLYKRALSAAEVSTIYGYNGAPSGRPVVSLTSPSAGATISDTVSVTATATPAGTAAIATVQFQLDGSNFGSALTTAPYSASWNTTIAMNGTHSLTATATDSLGNAASSLPLIVTVNNASVSPVTAGSSTPSLGWQDLGPGTILTGAPYGGSATGKLVDCAGSAPPAYCATGTAGASFAFKALEQYTVAAQSGCAVDTVHKHMYCTGGGHGDYFGNQVYDVDLVAKRITRLTDPSPVLSASTINPDGTAPSSHTQQGLVYLANEDAVFVWALGVGPAPLVQNFGWWITNLRISPTWTQKASLPTSNTYYVVSGGTGCTTGLQTVSFNGGTGGTGSVYVSGGSPAGNVYVTAGGSGYSVKPTSGTVATCTGTVTFSGGSLSGGAISTGAFSQAGGNCFLDTSSATESVLCVDYGTYALYRYTPSLDTGPGSTPYTNLSGINGAEIAAGATCREDPRLKIIYCAGLSEGFGFPSGIYSIPLTGARAYKATNITSSTSGCAALYSSTNPGLAFDDSTGLMVGYVGSGDAITLFDPVSLTCVTRTFSGGPTSGYYPAESGTYDRFAYIPSLNQFFTMNKATTDMFSLNLDAPKSCDLNNDGMVNVVDVQLAINQALGVSTCGTASLITPGQCTAADVQRVIAAALGGACVTGP